MISDRLKKVILGVLRLKDFDLKDEMKAYEVPGWDSLNHVIVLVAIEKEYKIRFAAAEALRLNNIGELQVLLDKKTSGVN